jgi:hypothetical protein
MVAGMTGGLPGQRGFTRVFHFKRCRPDGRELKMFSREEQLRFRDILKKNHYLLPPEHFPDFPPKG